ncbi:MAG: fibronectin type III domain-containing protein [Verrucomicrobiaceae bacterium]|nr:fibronectin type III domain-containing protein [Verrucomicrobiaceae bacterium]
MYSIFVPPRHGQLTLQPESGVALYRTNPDLSPDEIEDRFEFRVRDAGSGDKGVFSAAVEVRLKIAARSARLEVPDIIDFGKVVMGGGQAREFLIKNSGDAAFIGKMDLPNGFQIQDKDQIELNVGVGSSQSFMVNFLGKKKPEKGRAFLQVHPTPPGGRVTFLYEVAPPFQVQDKITLEFDETSFSRNVELRIKNPFADKIKVKLALHERLKAEHFEHEIAGGSTKGVRLNIPKNDAAFFSGFVTVSAKGFSKKVQVFAEECPARIVVVGVTGNSVLNFKGMLEASAEELPDGFKRNIELRNVGGRAANLSVMVNPPFHLVAGNDPREIKPGESFICPVELRPEKVGNVSESLNIDYAGKPLVVSLQGQVLLPPGTSFEQVAPPPAWRGKKGDGTSSERLDLRALSHGRNETRRKFSPAVPPVRRIKIIEQRSESLLISWKMPEGGDWRYVVEALVSLKDKRSGFPVRTWVEIKPEHLTLTIHEREVRAEIAGIVPGGEFQFRIFTLNNQGWASSPATLRLAVKSKKGAFEWFRIWMVPLTGLVLAMIFSLVRRIRHERQLYG